MRAVNRDEEACQFLAGLQAEYDAGVAQKEAPCIIS